VLASSAVSPARVALSIASAALALSSCRPHEAPAPAPPTYTSPGPPEPPPPAARVEVVPIDVPGDVPAFFLRGAPGTTGRMVFLHVRCGHAQGYVQAFQFAAAKRGSVLALQGDVPCGGAYRRWTVDPELQDRRIASAFRAAGETGELRDLTVLGYSQGEVLAERLAGRFPERYTRAVLIGAPAAPSLERLRRLRGVVLLAGEGDAGARALMRPAAPRLSAAGVPATYMEMPGAPHAAMADGERVMDEAFSWLASNERPAGR
jgi:pimeloyl-ACP methyl ester carboxylesterase